MHNFDDTRTKEFEKLFEQKDIVGLENFIEKNLEYKKIYNLFKGRFYFDKNNKFQFKISPSYLSASLISYLPDKNSSPSLFSFSSSSLSYNLEILIIQRGKDNEFHRLEQIHFDAQDNIQFVDLEDDALLLANNNKPDKLIRRFFRNSLQTIPQIELVSKDDIEMKKQQLMLIRDAYRNRFDPYQSKQPLRQTLSIMDQKIKNIRNA